MSDNRFIPNSFQIPNAFVDELLAVLSGNAVKCYLLIARKTTGWQKESDLISTKQFMTMTNIKDKRTVYSVVGELEEKGLIRTLKNNGEITEFYLVRELPVAKNVTGSNECAQLQKTPPVARNDTAPVAKNAPTTSSKKCHSTKDNNINTKNNNPLNPPVSAVLDYFNRAREQLAQALGERKPSGFKLNRATESAIKSRLAEYSEADCQRVVDYLIAKWGRDEKMAEYLRPSTLFAAKNFAEYVPLSEQWENRGRPICVAGKWLPANGAALPSSLPTVEEVREVYLRYISNPNLFRRTDFSNKHKLLVYHCVVGLRNKKPLERDFMRVAAELIRENVEKLAQLPVPKFEENRE